MRTEGLGMLAEERGLARVTRRTRIARRGPMRLRSRSRRLVRGTAGGGHRSAHVTRSRFVDEKGMTYQHGMARVSQKR